MQVTLQSKSSAKAKQKTVMITIWDDGKSHTRHCHVMADGSLRGRWLDLTAQMLSYAEYNSAQMALALKQAGGDNLAVYKPVEFIQWQTGDMMSSYNKQLEAETNRCQRIMDRQKTALEKRLFELEMQESAKRKVS